MLKIMLPLLSILILQYPKSYFTKKMNWWEITTSLLVISLISMTMLPPYTSVISPLLSTDPMSNTLITLSIFISALMMLTSTKILYWSSNPSTFIMMNIMLLLTLVMCFSSTSMFMFYLMFEASLIPTMMIIIMWGYQPERIQASMYMMMYTVMASLPMFVMFYYLFMTMKTTNLFNPMINSSLSWWPMTMSMMLIMGFLVKLPMFTTHLWLPKAHVEAPIAGSMVLAAILLKLGGYGIARMMCMTPTLLIPVKTPLITLSLVGATITSLICIRQSDLKSLIAYSSVGHMGLMLAGLMTNSSWGLGGTLAIMIAHALTSSAMFALANMSYEVTHTRSMYLMKGMYMTTPIMSLWWFLFCASNMAAPPSINLMSEIMLITSITSFSLMSIMPLMMVTFLTGAYSLIMFSSTQHGFSHSNSNPNPSMSQKNYSMLTLHFLPIIMLITKPSVITLWF